MAQVLTNQKSSDLSPAVGGRHHRYFPQQCDSWGLANAEFSIGRARAEHAGSNLLFPNCADPCRPPIVGMEIPPSRQVTTGLLYDRRSCVSGTCQTPGLCGTMVGGATGTPCTGPAFVMSCNGKTAIATPQRMSYAPAYPTGQEVFAIRKDPYTGEIEELTQNVMPPPNTEKGERLKSAIFRRHPRMIALQGGYGNPQGWNLRRREHTATLGNIEEHAEGDCNKFFKNAARMGKPIPGDPTLADEVRKQETMLNARDLYHNMNGFKPEMPQLGKEVPFGYIGYTPMARFTPPLVPTQQLDNINMFKHQRVYEIGTQPTLTSSVCLMDQNKHRPTSNRSVIPVLPASMVKLVPDQQPAKHTAKQTNDWITKALRADPTMRIESQETSQHNLSQTRVFQMAGHQPTLQATATEAPKRIAISTYPQQVVASANNSQRTNVGVWVAPNASDKTIQPRIKTLEQLPTFQTSAQPMVNIAKVEMRAPAASQHEVQKFVTRTNSVQTVNLSGMAEREKQNLIIPISSEALDNQIIRSVMAPAQTVTFIGSNEDMKHTKQHEFNPVVDYVRPQQQSITDNSISIGQSDSLHSQSEQLVIPLSLTGGLSVLPQGTVNLVQDVPTRKQGLSTARVTNKNNTSDANSAPVILIRQEDAKNSKGDELHNTHSSLDGNLQAHGDNVAAIGEQEKGNLTITRVGNQKLQDVATMNSASHEEGRDIDAKQIYDAVMNHRAQNEIEHYNPHQILMNNPFPNQSSNIARSYDITTAATNGNGDTTCEKKQTHSQGFERLLLSRDLSNQNSNSSANPAAFHIPMMKRDLSDTAANIMMRSRMSN